MAEIVARVGKITGQALARDPDGNVRVLKSGDPIREGDVVQSTDGSQIQMLMADGREITLNANEAAKFDAEVASPDLPDAGDSSVQNTPQAFTRISRTVVGQDGTFSFDDDGGKGAAGAEQTEGHSFVELVRVVENVDPLAFQFGTTRFPLTGTIQGSPVVQPLVSAGVIVAGALDSASDSGLKGDALTNDATPTLAGIATPGAIIEVVTPNGVRTTVASAGGTWSITLLAPLPDGPVSFPVTARDTLGGVATTTISLVVDSAISLTAQLEPASDTALVGDNLTRDNTPTLRGTGEPGASITVTSPTGEVLSTTVAANGTWSVTPSTPLPDGAAAFVVTATDAAGNTASATVSLTVDTALTLTAQLAPASDSGTAGDNLTNDNTPTLRGPGEPGASITVTSPTGEVLTTTVAADGTWSVTPSTPLPDGAAVFAVSAIDAAGNTATTTVNLTVDTVALASITVNSVTADNIINAAESGQTIAITGTAGGDAKTGDTVTLVVNGNIYTGTLTVGLTYSIDVAGSDLAADTTIDASVVVTDVAGNTATGTTVHTHAVDTVATGAPTVVITEDTNNDGLLSLAEISGDADVSVTLPSGAVAGDTLTVTDGTTTNTFVLTAAQIGAGFVDTAFAPPANGTTLVVSATLTDQAGNTSLPGSDSASRDSTPPVAANVSVQGDEDAASISLTLSATDVGGPIALYTITTVPVNGLLYSDSGLTQLVVAGGAVTSPTLFFVPNIDWSGSTSFGYTATDLAGNVSAPAVASVLVNPVSDAPLLTVVAASGNEDSAIALSIAVAEKDVDGSETLGNVTLGNVPAGAVLSAGTNNGDGTWTLTPAQLTGLTLTPPANFNGTLNLSVSAVSQDGIALVASSSTTLAVTVTGTNDLPVAVDDSKGTGENTVLSSSVPAASDVDGTIASYALGTGLGAGNGSLSFNPDGSYTFTPGGDFDALAPGATRDVTFTYTATDNNGGVSAPKTVTITVTGTNDLPVAVDDSKGTGENTVLSSSVPAASDVDGTIASYALGTGLGAGNGSLSFNPDGSYTFTPGGDFDALAPGATRDVTFTYTATDNNGGVSAPKTVTITVTGTNDLPVAVDDSKGTGENTVLSSSVPAASDVDGTIASYALGTGLGAGNGSLSFNPDGSYTFTPGGDFDALAPGATRDVTFTYTATDNNGGVSAPKTVTITVTGTNDLPVAVDDSKGTGENTVLSSSVPAASDVDGTIASYALGTGLGAGNGSLSFNPDGSYTFTPGGDFDALALGATRDVTFTYTATDNNGGVSAPKTVTITVTGTNDLPVLDLDGSVAGTGYSTTFAENGSAVRVVDSDLSISDVDSATCSGATITLANAQAGDVLAIGAVPSNIIVTQVGNSITLSGSGTAGDYRAALLAVTFANTSENPNATARTINISVLDDAGLASNVAVSTVNVTAVNDPPVLDLDANDSTASGRGFITYVARNTAAGGATSIADTDVTISDLDHTQLTGATITLTNGTSGSQGLVAWAGANANGMTATVSPNGLSVTLSGSASLAAYQAALQNVKFASYNNTIGAFNVNVVVSDGVGNSNTASTTVNVVSSLRPVAFAASASGSEDPAMPIAITLSGDDPNGTVNFFRIDALPTNGTLYRDEAKTLAVATGTDFAASGQALTLYFQPNTNWSGNATFTFSAKDNGGDYSSVTATGTVAVAAVADTPNLSTTNSFTEVFNTNWESQGPLTATADDRNNATHAKGAGPIEGWTLLTTASVADGSGTAANYQSNQFYFNADGDKIGSTLFSAAGMVGGPTGTDPQKVFLHLDNAANGTVATSNYQTLGITQTINVSDAAQVYQLSFNYAPDDVAAANSGIEVLIDGVVVGSYSLSGTGATGLNWQTISVGHKFTTTGNHTISIRTTSPEAGTGVGAYIDDIRLVAAQGAMQWTNTSASYGGATELSLAGKITTSLVDTDGSESLSVRISNIPGGGRIISGSNTYYPLNGSVTIPVAQLAAAKLLVPEEFSGKIELGVTSTATETSNASTASIGQSLVFYVFQPGLTAFSPPTLAVSNATAIEGGYCVFNVALSSANPSDVVVSLAASNGTAFIGADTGAMQYSTNGGASWTTLAGNLTIPAGSSSVLVRVPATVDSLIEGTETFTLTATRVSGTLANLAATGTGTIFDLDSGPILSVRPVGQWLMDEGVGPTATNEYRSIIGTLADVNTGNGLGLAQFVAGRSGNAKSAIQLDGKGAALATDPGELAGLSNSATVTFWIKTTQKASTDAAQFGGADIGWNRPSVLGSEQNGAVNDAQWGWLDNNGRIGINVGDTAGAKSTTVVADGTWHYVAITRNATTGQTELYVDGVREGNVTNSGLAGTITNVFGIGYTNGVNGDFSRNIANDKYLNAAIDDLRIYSTVMTTEQVQSIRRVETDHQDIAIANDGSALKLAVAAAAYDSVTISGLLAGWVVSDGTNAATSTGTTNAINISAWDFSRPLTITGVGATQSALLDIVATKGVHLVEQSISVVSVSNSYEGTAAGNNFAGTANSDMAFGYDGDDNLSGAGGDDRLVGGLGVDALNGGSGADILEGGAGNDSLTGGTGADVFVWKLADRGTALAPAVDTVTDFDPLSRALGGDSLDLRDLLVGETTGTALGQDNLGKYLHFEKTGANETTLHVSTTGGFSGGYATGVEDQKIVLQGADLTANGTLSDQAIIQDLLTKGKLQTD